MSLIAPALPVIDGRYEFRTLLGKRGRCSTYLALDRETRATVAFKEIRAESHAGQLRARLDDACLRFSKLEHPRIPRFLGVVSYDNRGPCVALVQQFVKGKTIAQHVAEGRRFVPSDVLSIAKGAGEALAYLHSRQPPVLHGSIEPGHILLDVYDSPFLIDFGVIERVLEEAGVPTGAAGGPPKGYVPFEQFAGRPVPASDVYSLGMTLVFALTGRDPLQEAAAWERAKIDPLWPEPLRRFLDGMTAPSWEKRWRSGASLVKALPREAAPAPRRGWMEAMGAAAIAALYFWLLQRSIAPSIPFALAPAGAAVARPAPHPGPQGPESPLGRRATPPLFSGEAGEAARRFLGAEHESGQVAWDQLHGRPLVFLRGRAAGYIPAFRAADGTLAVLESGRVLIGRPENWLRRISAPGCQCDRIALDEYENVWLETTCGLWRHDVAWSRASGPGPFPAARVIDPSGVPWAPRSGGEIDVGEGSSRRTVRLQLAFENLAHDHEGRVWTADGYGRVSVYDRQRLLAEAAP